MPRLGNSSHPPAGATVSTFSLRFDRLREENAPSEPSRDDTSVPETPYRPTSQEGSSVQLRNLML